MTSRAKECHQRCALLVSGDLGTRQHCVEGSIARHSQDLHRRVAADIAAIQRHRRDGVCREQREHGLRIQLAVVGDGHILEKQAAESPPIDTRRCSMRFS